MTEPVTFKDMPYARPDLAEVKARYAELASRLADAETFEAAETAFLEKDQLDRHVQTAYELVYIRHTIDTRDAFYDAESTFWDETMPELEQAEDAFKAALLSTPFRARLAEKYGELLFAQAEQQRRTIKPEIVEDMKRENALAQEYVKLIASAQIPFEGGTYTLSQLTPFKRSADDAERLAAWKAEGAWYKEHQADLDRIYDELTHVRDAMGKKLGYKNYLPLGYDRMGRLSYGRKDVERFREAVRTYVVPLADKIYRAQAERLGVAYPLSFADEALSFRSGNPAPRGGADDVLEAGRTFYRALSPETGAFFDMMLDRGLMDVLSTEGKAGGGYMTQIPDYDVPFIFANFNGTQGDVEVVTHEAGHAFSYYMNTDKTPIGLSMPSTEACEVHSMSMEFMAWPWVEEFFGDDARKYRYVRHDGRPLPARGLRAPRDDARRAPRHLEAPARRVHALDVSRRRDSLLRRRRGLAAPGPHLREPALLHRLLPRADGLARVLGHVAGRLQGRLGALHGLHAPGRHARLHGPARARRHDLAL